MATYEEEMLYNQKQKQAEQQVMLQHMSTLPPEERAIAMKRFFQDYEGQEGVLDEQLAQASALRDQEQPQGVQAGNQFVAANPLSHLAKGAERFVGGMRGAQAIKDKRALSEDRTGALQDSANAQLAAYQQSQQPQMTPEQAEQKRAIELLREAAANQGQTGFM